MPLLRRATDERPQTAHEMRRVAVQTHSPLHAGWGCPQLCEGEYPQLAVVAGPLIVGREDAEFVAFRVGQHHPGLFALTDVDVPSAQTNQAVHFGPLVVAAVRLDAGASQKLRDSGVRDSKTMSDDTALRLGGALRGTCAHAVARLDPDEYNATHHRPGHLNAMLADLHARAIRELVRPGIRVVIDQFGPERLMSERLAGLDIALEQRPRAEEVPAVAAASVIAREEFLLALRELSERFGVDLHKGAGEPVDRAARRFVALHGREKLVHVAKLHFKNTQRV